MVNIGPAFNFSDVWVPEEGCSVLLEFEKNQTLSYVNDLFPLFRALKCRVESLQIYFICRLEKYVYITVLGSLLGH
jgi:hypothetical protein